MAISLNKGSPKPAQSSGAAPEAPKSLAFMHKGAAAKAIFEKEEKRKELASKGNIFRFWIPKDGEGKITFLDGMVVDGMLDATFYYEHQVNMNGSWMNWFVCTQESEPCPVCEGGASPAYVAVLSVIDHGEYTSKKDGKVHKDNVKLFTAKADTYKALQKKALKNGGLRGCTFDVSRTGEKSASVGSSFDFVEKLSDLQLKQLYGPKKAGELDRSIPINYEEMLTGMYLSAKDLRKLGFGSSNAPIGSEPNASYDNDV